MISSRLFLIISVFSFVSPLFSQPSLKWRRLPTAPFLSSSRHDDSWFINERVGWIVNGIGQVWKTTDGGGTWMLQLEKNQPTSRVYFRAVTFADSMRGWACNLGTEEFGGATDTNIIYQTTNSGATWFANNNFAPQKPRGICGIQAVGDSCVYGVGRVRGPARFIRSTDRGTTWEVRDMSAFVMGLLDVYFWTRDSGIIVGHTGPLNESSSGRILFTSDRGTTWRTQFTSSRIGEWCWKINFPSRTVGYVSLQRNSGAPTYFLKTTDGGFTWTEKLLSTGNYYVQGIGFATENIGWVGGNTSQPTWKTTNGGDTWFPDTFGVRVNRFRMLNDSIGYATGQTVYKYSKTLPSDVAVTPEPNLPSSYVTLRAYPSPFNPTATIEYSLLIGADDPATPLHLLLRVFDLAGKEVATLLNEPKRAGTYQLQFDARNLASGMYLARLEATKAYDDAPMIKGNYVATRKLLLVR
jgi:photosystem II stability/assembly factor-like uncharacterized protein